MTTQKESSIFSRIAGMKGLVRRLSNKYRQLYEYHDGTERDLLDLGLKGVAACDMYRLGVPIPPGFIVSAQAYRDFTHSTNNSVESCMNTCINGVRALEKKTNTKFGVRIQDDVKPLLLCIRASAPVKISGLMNSVLNLGINDHVVAVMAGPDRRYQRYALDTHRRFLQNFGVTVMGLSCERYEHILSCARTRDSVQYDRQLSIESLAFVVEEFKKVAMPPDDPWEQLSTTVRAMYSMWLERRDDTERATYRQEHINDGDASISIIVQKMVCSNRNSRSGTGVCCLPGSRADSIKGNYNRMEEGDSAAGPLKELKVLSGEAHRSLMDNTEILRQHYGNELNCIEFAVEDGDLFILDVCFVLLLYQ